jgi:hypothetical protein
MNIYVIYIPPYYQEYRTKDDALYAWNVIPNIQKSSYVIAVYKHRKIVYYVIPAYRNLYSDLDKGKTKEKFYFFYCTILQEPLEQHIIIY